jgi:ornithine cyclodeaminase
VHVIDAAQVRAHLSMPACIEVMAKAMLGVSDGHFFMPPRMVMPLFDGSAHLGLMPGSLSGPLIYGAKIVSLHPGNALAGRPSIQGLIALFDHNTGQPVAVVDGGEITTLRTGAASGLATQLLARPDAATLGLLGSGAQAGSHLDAICSVRAIDAVRVWSRNWQHACAFAERHRGRFRCDIVPVREQVDAASCDIVCAVTSAAEPVIRGEWIRPGAHVNLVGAHSPNTRESDTALIKSAMLYVDSRVSAMAEAGDILLPIDEGAIDVSHIVGEIGELLAGRVAGRTTTEQITVYKSLGLIAQDLAAAHAVYLSVSVA